MANPFYNWFYRVLPIKKVETNFEIYILTDQESKSLKRQENIAYILAGIIGALGVLILYIPTYFWPSWFAKTPLTILERSFEIPIRFIGWSLFLVIIEMILLSFLHLYFIHQLAVITGFLTYENKNVGSNSSILINLSLEKKDKSISRYGIDPLAGMNKRALFLWNLLIGLKATFSNMLFKVFIQRVLGRYAFQWIQDLAGVPVFAAWNIWGTYQVLKQGRVVIMGQNLIETGFLKIKALWPSLQGNELLVYQTLYFIAVSKRDYHFNHGILTKLFVEHYRLIPDQNIFDEGVYLKRLQQASPDIQNLCKWIIAAGFLLDGTLSIREKRRLNQLEALGLAPTTWAVLQEWKNNFLAGKGWEKLPIK